MPLFRSRILTLPVVLLVAACATTSDVAPTTATTNGAASTAAAPRNGEVQLVAGESGKALQSGTGGTVRGTVPPPRAVRSEGGAPTMSVGGQAVPITSSGAQLFKGTGEVIAPPRARVERTGAQDVSFKFEQAPVREVVHAVLGELLGYTYVIHQAAAGTVTVSTAAPLPADQALAVLEAVLQGNGLLMAQDAAGVFHIGTPDALRGIVAAPKRIEISPLPAGSGAAIVPLKYIGAAEMADVLRPVARPEAILRVDNLRNLLILSGSRNQLEGWLEIVRIFDVDLLKGMSIGVFPLQYASVREIDSALRSMVTGGEAAQPGAPAATPQAQGQAQAQAQAQAQVGAVPRHPLFGAIRLIPLERLNSLIVITPRPTYLDEIKVWIDRMDRPGGGDGDPRLFVYQVQNGSATHLANVLNGLFGMGGPSGPTDSGVAPGLRAAVGSTTTGSRLGGSGLGGSGGFQQSLPVGGARSGAGAGLAAMPQTGTRAAGTGGVTTSTLGIGVRIVGDDLNNAVLVYATPLEFAKIEETLRRLDAPVTQVIIEATIVEVSLTDDLQYGLQWYFTNSMGGYTGQGQLNPNLTGGIGPIQPGFSYALLNTLGQIRVVLNALAERSLVRVISSPSVMVIDNHTAAIQVGDQQPIRSSETVTSGGNVTNSIEYKDTGVLLAVTPSVNSGDMVAMTINQSITDVGPIDIATGQRAFLNRQIGSRVAVRSGEALVLGGLIRDSVTDGSSGLPILSKIPVIGALFGTQTRNGARTELLVVITPKVVRTSHDARSVSTEMRERMRGFRALVQEQNELLPKEFLEQMAPPPPPAPQNPPVNGKQK